MKRGLIIAGLVLPVLAVAVWLLLGRAGSSGPRAPLPEPSSGFAFMEMGGQATLSPTLREHLDERLGDGALEQIGTLDLTFDHRALFQVQLPDIAKLDQALNRSPRERVEHRIVRLTYHYPEYKGTPFDLVQLIFSRHDDRPLCFKISFSRNRAEASQSVIQKYGPPQATLPLEGGGSIKRWEKPDQVMILLQSPDRLGRLTPHVMIYFVDAIKAMLAREQGRSTNAAKEEQHLF